MMTLTFYDRERFITLGNILIELVLNCMLCSVV